MAEKHREMLPKGLTVSFKTVNQRHFACPFEEVETKVGDIVPFFRNFPELTLMDEMGRILPMGFCMLPAV